MMLSLLAGLKTQTRRTRGLEDVPVDVTFTGMKNGYAHFERVTKGCVEEPCDPVRSPYGSSGGTLWVREGVRRDGEEMGYGLTQLIDRAVYIADGARAPCDSWGWKNKSLPAIHMPWGMRRFELDLTDVRVERLHTITEGDAQAEGMMRSKIDTWWWPSGDRNWTTALDAYRAGWEWLNGKDSWERNPFVWVLTFTARKVR
jgi:hypothetical protein